MRIHKDDIYSILEDQVGVDTTCIDAGDLLFSSRIVDSFALVTIIMELEKRAGIKIAADDVTLENFDSINQILAFVERISA